MLQNFYYQVRAWSGIVSVALYACVPFVYAWRVRTAAATPTNGCAANARMAKRLRQQRKMLITMGLSTASTLIFYVGSNAANTFVVAVLREDSE